MHLNSEYPSGSIFDLVSDDGSFDGYRLHWRTPAVMTPLVLQPSALRNQYIGMGVDGEILNDKALVDRRYSLTVSEDTVDGSIPFAAKGAVRKVCSGVLTVYASSSVQVMNQMSICLQSFVADGTYNELYTVQLNYQQSFADQRGVETKYNVVRQMATPPIPYPLFTINRELEC